MHLNSYKNFIQIIYYHILQTFTPRYINSLNLSFKQNKRKIQINTQNPSLYKTISYTLKKNSIKNILFFPHHLSPHSSTKLTFLNLYKPTLQKPLSTNN